MTQALGKVYIFSISILGDLIRRVIIRLKTSTESVEFGGQVRCEIKGGISEEGLIVIVRFGVVTSYFKERIMEGFNFVNFLHVVRRRLQSGSKGDNDHAND